MSETPKKPTAPKKTRATKKTEKAPAPAPEPSNQPSHRAVEDIPASEGYLGAYSSKGKQDE